MESLNENKSFLEKMNSIALLASSKYGVDSMVRPLFLTETDALFSVFNPETPSKRLGVVSISKEDLDQRSCYVRLYNRAKSLVEGLDDMDGRVKNYPSLGSSPPPTVGSSTTGSPIAPTVSLASGIGPGLGEETETFDPSELEIGRKEEMEHTDDPKVAEKIAKDHLREDPHYYKKLKKCGLVGGTKESAGEGPAFGSTTPPMDSELSPSLGTSMYQQESFIPAKDLSVGSVLLLSTGSGTARRACKAVSIDENKVSVGIAGISEVIDFDADSTVCVETPISISEASQYFGVYPYSVDGIPQKDSGFVVRECSRLGGPKDAKNYDIVLPIVVESSYNAAREIAETLNLGVILKEDMYLPASKVTVGVYLKNKGVWKQVTQVSADDENVHFRFKDSDTVKVSKNTEVKIMESSAPKRHSTVPVVPHQLQTGDEFYTEGAWRRVSKVKKGHILPGHTHVSFDDGHEKVMFANNKFHVIRHDTVKESFQVLETFEKLPANAKFHSPDGGFSRVWMKHDKGWHFFRKDRKRGDWSHDASASHAELGADEAGHEIPRAHPSIKGIIKQHFLSEALEEKLISENLLPSQVKKGDRIRISHSPGVPSKESHSPEGLGTVTRVVKYPKTKVILHHIKPDGKYGTMVTSKDDKWPDHFLSVTKE